jgi:hypothetical protein
VEGITIIMKTTQVVLSSLVAIGSTSVALVTLVGLIPADFGFATLTVLGLTAFALFDYSRPRQSLVVGSKVLRPSLPSESTSPVAYEVRRAA